jgi:hypothetical protein
LTRPLEFVNGRGELVTLSEDRNRDEFRGAVVGLGAIGLVTKVTLRVVPAFDVRQWVWENMPLPQFTTNFDAIMNAATASPPSPPGATTRCPTCGSSAGPIPATGTRVVGGLGRRRLRATATRS